MYENRKCQCLSKGSLRIYNFLFLKSWNKCANKAFAGGGETIDAQWIIFGGRILLQSRTER